jgi:hypothetical protein
LFPFRIPTVQCRWFFSILRLLYVLPLFPPLFVQQKSNTDVADVQSKPQLQ